MLFGEWAEFCTESEILVGFSVGGLEEVHDACWVDPGGKPTFERVMGGSGQNIVKKDRRFAQGVTHRFFVRHRSRMSARHVLIQVATRRCGHAKSLGRILWICKKW